MLYVRKEAAWAAEAKAGDRTACGGCEAGAAVSIIADGLASCGQFALSLAARDVVVSCVQRLPGEDLADFCATGGVDGPGRACNKHEKVVISKNRMR